VVFPPFDEDLGYVTLEAMLAAKPVITCNDSGGPMEFVRDRENGLLVWAPVYLLFPAAWVVAGRRYAIWLLPTAYLFCISAGHDQWWGGFSPAARFLMPLVPVFAVIGAVALRHRLFRVGSLILLIPQIFISADGWQHTRSLWPQGDGHNRVLSDLLTGLGAGERWIPSLRTSTMGGSPVTVIDSVPIPGASCTLTLAVNTLVIWIPARTYGRKPSRVKVMV